MKKIDISVSRASSIRKTASVNNASNNIEDLWLQSHKTEG